MVTMKELKEKMGTNKNMAEIDNFLRFKNSPPNMIWMAGIKVTKFPDIIRNGEIVEYEIAEDSPLEKPDLAFVGLKKVDRSRLKKVV